MRGLLAILLSGLVLSGCAIIPTCGPGEGAGQTVQLFFGRNIGDAPGVDEAAFGEFVDRELSPRFPDGMTILDAEGRWSNGRSSVTEGSKLVILVQEGVIDRKALDAVRAAYKYRFSQEAVLQTVSSACVAY